MLTSHEEIIIPPESHFMLWNYENYRLWKPADGYEGFLSDLFNSTKFETWKIDRVELNDFLKGRMPASYSDLCADIYIFYGLKQSKTASLWGDKNSLWIEKIQVLYELFSNAKFIHIVRDGRDVATSYVHLNEYSGIRHKYFPSLPNSIELIAKIWNRNVLLISSFFSEIPSSNYIEVKFEDLVVNSADVMRNILGFLKLPFSSSVLEFYRINRLNNYEPAEFLAWKEKLNEPLDISCIGKYKSRLNESELLEFEQIAADGLMKYGYL